MTDPKPCPANDIDELDVETLEDDEHLYTAEDLEDE